MAYSCRETTRRTVQDFISPRKRPGKSTCKDVRPQRSTLERNIRSRQNGSAPHPVLGGINFQIPPGYVDREKETGNGSLSWTAWNFFVT